MVMVLFKPEKLKNFIECKGEIASAKFKDIHGEEVTLTLCERNANSYVVSINRNWLDSYLFDQNYKLSIDSLHDSKIISSFGAVKMTVSELRKSINYFNSILEDKSLVC